MRIKLYIPSEYKRINIRNVEMRTDYLTNLPKIYFKCHRKHESAVMHNPVVFTDSRGKRLFESERAYLYLRCYESDSREPMVKFEVTSINVGKWGLASPSYVSKFLKLACNKTKFPPPSPPPKPAPPPPEKPRLTPYGAGVMRYYERVIAFRRRAIFYKIFIKFRYIFLKFPHNVYKISTNFLVYLINSTAPT